MSSLKLNLKSKHGDLNLKLHRENIEKTVFDLLSETVEFVYADCVYEIILYNEIEDFPWAEDISKIEIYINGEQIEYDIKNKDNSVIVLLNKNNDCLFNDCYGYIQIAIKLENLKNESIILYTDYLGVYFKDVSQNRILQKMIEYIYNYQEKYLYFEDIKPQAKVGLKQLNNNKELSVSIELIDKIIKTYTKQYSYFKLNAKSKICEHGIIDDFNKLNKFNNKTLRYIINHPGELKEIKSNKGVYINKKYYIPKKTLMDNKSLTYDLYEHRYMLGFLKHIYNYIFNSLQKIDDLLGKIDNNRNIKANYISSITYVLKPNIIRLNTYRERLGKSLKEIISLLYSYQNAFNIKYREINNMPNPTKIFMSLPQYNVIYMCIYEWFMYGEYNLEKEEFLLPFLVNNKIYEHYLLLKILNYFEYKGIRYEEKKSKIFNYSLRNDAKYVNLNYNNTFYFVKDNLNITIYYQPVVYGNKYNSVDRNGINIIRNNSIRTSNDEYKSLKNVYYSPDYLIKFSNGNSDKYVILDAKYSKTIVVKNNYFVNLVFKYLFSFSTENQKDMIDKMVVICGKSDKYESYYSSAYDIAEQQLEYINSQYKADIVTILEDINLSSKESSSLHNEIFDKIFKAYI